MAYSAVAKGRCGWVFSPTDLTFNFSIIYRSPALTGNHYSVYQLFLYQTISEHREKDMTFVCNCPTWLEQRRGYLSTRGKKFRGGTRSFNLEEEISKRRVAEPRVSASLVRLQHGGCR